MQGACRGWASIRLTGREAVWSYYEKAEEDLIRFERLARTRIERNAAPAFARQSPGRFGRESRLLYCYSGIPAPRVQVSEQVWLSVR